MPMKFVTRENVKVDRVACPWVIRRFVDPGAEFRFVPAGSVLEVARREGAVAFDAPGAELYHRVLDGEERVTFDAVIERYGLTDPALLDLAEIVRGADARLARPRPESAGLAALAAGFRRTAATDEERLRGQFPVYDALYAYCQERVASPPSRPPSASG